MSEQAPALGSRRITMRSLMIGIGFAALGCVAGRALARVRSPRPVPDVIQAALPLVVLLCVALHVDRRWRRWRRRSG